MRNDRIHCSPSRRGVSLIEALTVIVLVSATASTAIFKISSASPIDPARQSAQSFAETLREARQLAITYQAPVTVSLDLKSQPARWVFKAAQSAQGPAKDWDLPVEGATAVEGTCSPIRFDGAGNASYFGEWKFRGAPGYYVRLEPMGARVSMKAID